MLNYSDDSIQTKSDIDHMRLRVSSYINNSGSDGITHITREILDNSFDEFGVLGDDKNSRLHLLIIRCHELNDVIISVKDNGRGIPLGKVKDAFTKARTSGKFNSASYSHSAGLNGIGGKVAFALSTDFRAFVARDNKKLDLNINYKNFESTEPKIYDNTDPEYLFKRGTMVMFRPDHEIFKNIDEFIEEGYKNIQTLLKVINYFNDYQMYMHIITVTPEQFKHYHKYFFDDNIHIDDILQCHYELYDKVDAYYHIPSTKSERESQIKQFFNIAIWKEAISFRKEFEDREDPLYIDFKSYLSIKHHEVSNCTLSIVNNIVFRNHDDVHITEFRKALKKVMVTYIKNKDVQTFFLNKYIFPFYYVIKIKFSGAEFVGLTKNRYQDDKFKVLYAKWLNEYFEKNKDIVETMYGILEKDIEAKFKNLRDSNSPSKSSNLTLQLNSPDMFKDCNVYGEDSELFLCEGKSAMSNTSRDSNFQAIYGLSGKPFNSITSEENRDKSLNDLLKNKIFQDIFAILNVRPNDPELTGLRFNKIFLMTDADEHGKHITNIILGNLYIYNPALITKGKIHITVPPLYKLSITGKDTIFAKNHEEYLSTLTSEVYTKQYCFEMKDEVTGEEKTLNTSGVIDVVNAIFDVGSTLENLAKENALPLSVMEVIMTNKLHIKKVSEFSYEELCEMFCTDLVTYDEVKNVLTLSYPNEDIGIYLGNLIIDDTLERYEGFNLHTKSFRITSKSVKLSDRRASPWMSSMYVYEMLSSINKKYTSEKLKGLGSMNPKDTKITCMNPETRYVYQIKKMDNIDNIFKYLGDNPEFRKQLMVQ